MFINKHLESHRNNSSRPKCSTHHQSQLLVPNTLYFNLTYTYHLWGHRRCKAFCWRSNPSETLQRFNVTCWLLSCWQRFAFLEDIGLSSSSSVANGLCNLCCSGVQNSDTASLSPDPRFELFFSIKSAALSFSWEGIPINQSSPLPWTPVGFSTQPSLCSGINLS